MTILISRFEDEPGMAELLRYFVTDLKMRCAAMETAVAEGDHQTLRTLARQLKGTAGAYGFLPISEAATVLEAAIDGRGSSVAEPVAAVLALCQLARAPMSELEAAAEAAE